MLMQGSRSKRPHSEVDDCDECIPISKRINRLNLEGQRKSQDDQAVCAQQEMNGHGSGVDPQLSSMWCGEMGRELGPGYASLLQPAAQYHHHITCPPTYPHSAEQLASPVPIPTMQSPNIVDSPAPHPAFPGHSFSQQTVAVGMRPCPPPQQAGLGPQGFQDGRMGMADECQYDPELGEGENPHYYHINQLLFTVHCQRMRREGYPLDSRPPSSFS